MTYRSLFQRMRHYLSTGFICAVALVMVSHAPANAISANASLQTQINEKNRLTASLQVKIDTQLNVAEKALAALATMKSVADDVKAQLKAQLEQTIATLKSLKTQVQLTANNNSASGVDNAAKLASQIDVQINGQSILKSEITIEIQRRFDAIALAEQAIANIKNVGNEVVGKIKERVAKVKSNLQELKTKLASVSTDAAAKSLAVELNASYDSFASITAQANLLVDVGSQVDVKEKLQSFTNDLRATLKSIAEKAKASGEKTLSSIPGISFENGVWITFGDKNNAEGEEATSGEDGEQEAAAGGGGGGMLDGGLTISFNAEKLLENLFNIENLITAISEISASVIALIASILEGDIDGSIANATDLLATILGQIEQNFSSVVTVEGDLAEIFDGTKVLDQALALLDN